MSTSVTPGAPAPAGPAPAAPVAAAGAPGAVVTDRPLPVSPGQALAARVLAVQAGMVELSLAGGTVTAASDLPLEPGQTLRLVVGEAGADRVTLRLQPDAPGPGGSPGAAAAAAAARATPAGALAAAGIPAAAASALLAALAEAGAAPGDGAAATALATRAAAAGVGTPATAAAFARLDAAGLPTTPASVAGLARLLDGAPLGRAIATLLDGAAAAAAAGGPPTGPAPGPGGLASPAAGGWSNWTNGAGPIGPSPQNPVPMGVPGPMSNRVDPGGPFGPHPATPGPGGPATPITAAILGALADLTEGIGTGATSGSAELLRRAISDLGGNLEARLAAGDPPDAPPLRALLHALATHPGTDAALARSATGIADGLAAQGLAGATIPPPGAAAPDPAQQGAYLQVPLPGGGTAEVRVAPDGGHDAGDGRERPRRLAFLLHLSALGPVMIEATAGGGAVDATVRVGTDEARRFLAPLAGDLAASLRRAAPAASVSVERLPGPAPERLLAPPPPSGLDLSA
ncbi:hypothetical protein [Miltoncostaea oceani]|uniref:hypothetical protein n=1 Tax=Miltoncostaea oceani TaxID=2843216 RepID=UPI001C3DF342|nr:hypothetical protein [Miltoncostaea oceani]